MASIIIILPSVASGTELDRLLSIMLCPVIVKILGAFRRHFIPFFVLVGEIILVMAILITVDVVLRCGRWLTAWILVPGLLIFLALKLFSTLVGISSGSDTPLTVPVPDELPSDAPRSLLISALCSCVE
eukprot:13352730-Ditylum_brightwellii.AAC.1